LKGALRSGITAKFSPETGLGTLKRGMGYDMMQQIQAKDRQRGESTLEE